MFKRSHVQLTFEPERFTDLAAGRATLTYTSAYWMPLEMLNDRAALLPIAQGLRDDVWNAFYGEIANTVIRCRGLASNPHRRDELIEELDKLSAMLTSGGEGEL